MVSCRDDLISPTVILCSLNRPLSSSFSSHLHPFSRFILFYFLIHISASFAILPRPFPIFSLSLFSPHHFVSASLLFPPATPLNLWSWENWKWGESAALTPSNNTTVLSFCPDMIWEIQLGETLTHFALSLFLLSCDFLSTWSRGPHRWKI